MAESSTGSRLAGSAIGKKGECQFVIGLYNILQPIDQCIFCNVEARVAERLTVTNFTLGGPGFNPSPLLCFLRQGTLLHFASLHPGV